MIIRRRDWQEIKDKVGSMVDEAKQGFFSISDLDDLLSEMNDLVLLQSNEKVRQVELERLREENEKKTFDLMQVLKERKDLRDQVRNLTEELLRGDEK